MSHSSHAQRRSETVRKHRASLTSRVRTYVKKLLKLIQIGSAEQVYGFYQETQSELDKAARKGIIHPHAAARIKSRLNLRVKHKFQTPTN